MKARCVEMGTGVERITMLLTGELPFIVYTALLLTIPVSWILLRLYRRAVIRTMEKQSNQMAIPQPTERATPASPPEKGLAIKVLDPSQMPKHISRTTCQNMLLQTPTKAAFVYLVAGLGYAIFMCWGILTSDGTPFTPIRVGITVMVYGWPIVLAVQYVTGTTRQRWLKPIFVYWGIYYALAILASVNNPNAGFLDMIALWVLINLRPTLAWWIVLNRHLRAVSPLVLIFLLLAVTGSLFMLELLFYNEFVFGLTVMLAVSLGVGSRGFIAINILVGLILFGIIGWFILKWIRWQYDNKKLSDQIITVDALWLLFMVINGAPIVFQGMVWILIPLMAFLIHKILTVVGFRWLIRQNQAPDHPCLLLLRVFALGRRSEKLFDAISVHWRYLGKIHMIAGPDLATTTIEPHEFMDYVSRNLGHNFIDSVEKLETAIAASQTHPDRDGRYRVEEFFCYGDTWKMVLARIANTCDTVLMDLRGFSPQNAGCIFEIHTLIHQLPLDRVIFTTDATTDHPFLENTIKSAWKALPDDSPNRDAITPKLMLFKYEKGDDITHVQLLESLCEAAVPIT